MKALKHMFANNIAENWNTITFIFAHRYIKAHFNELSSGDIISVEKIRKYFIETNDY